MKNTLIYQTTQSARAGPLLNQYFDGEKFSSLLKGSARILFKTSSVFPFDFFPDEISIDEYKVNILFHAFFLSEDIHSITIDMIKDIEVETGPLFATLKIVPDGFPGHPLTLRFLKKNEAKKIRQIIQGLMVAKRQGFDPNRIDGPDFLDNIESLGKNHFS